MTGSRYTLVPAGVTLTECRATPRSGGVGFAIVADQLSIAIADQDGRVMIATLHQSVLDTFCGSFADHLTEVSPEAAAEQLRAETWPSLQ